jgi:hypothetical protein
MLSKKKEMEISIYCYAAVGGMMATMLNDKMRGKNFSWDLFPEIMETHCEINVILSVSMNKRIEMNCRKLAAETGRDIAKHWVKEMNE